MKHNNLTILNQYIKLMTITILDRHQIKLSIRGNAYLINETVQVVLLASTASSFHLGIP